MTVSGFSHSEISGSTPACGFPELIAANHVLHRLLAPRHPPRALSSLTINICRRLHDSSACRVEAKVPNKKPRLIPRRDDDSNFALLSSVSNSPVTKSCSALARHAFASRFLFSYQGSVRSREPKILQLPSARVKKPWSKRDSNPRPSACKADALPAELLPLRPIQFSGVVGLVRFELTTPRLSSVCSNQLSYRPMSPALQRLIVPYASVLQN
jgi:hypothetical protein